VAEVPKVAMVFAAGLGTRMRPLTNDRPKALVMVDGRTLLDHLLDRLAEAGVEVAVVNAFHFAPALIDHLAGRAGRAPRIVISDESHLPEPLETEGGLIQALPLLEQALAATGGGDAIFTCNADAIWVEPTILQRMAAAWDPALMKGLLMLASLESSLGFDGPGDFFQDAAGALTRRGEAPAAPYAFAGIQLTLLSHFQGRAPGKRSLARIWFDSWAPAGQLHGLALEGQWLHVGDPVARDAAEAWLQAHA
jgi:MurNAc alpha-1-phosphate uridylyltransferase